jgi:hypothetical protein
VCIDKKSYIKRRCKSEYQSSFKPHWFVQSDAGEQVSQSTDWFKNITELRRKAEEYKKRSHGINFSSQHFAQLTGTDLSAWELESKTSDTTENLKNSSYNKRFLQVVYRFILKPTLRLSSFMFV